MASVGSLALCCIVSSVASMTRVSSSGVSPAGSRCTETRPEHFLRALGSGRVSTNVFLRRIHNFALDMTWLPWPVIPKKQWPAVHFKEKRAITWEEHQAIIAREPNLERKAFYQLAWNLGARNPIWLTSKPRILTGESASSVLLLPMTHDQVRCTSEPFHVRAKLFQRGCRKIHAALLQRRFEIRLPNTSKVCCLDSTKPRNSAGPASPRPFWF